MRPLEDELVRARMHNIAKRVIAELPIGWAFVVLATPFGKGGRLNYVANANRADVVRMMYEFIEVTKQGYGMHEPEASSADEDGQIGRLRQRVAELERELQKK